MNRWSRKHIYYIPLLILWFLLISSGIARRLNFDESLALKSGWLMIANIDSSPPFHMPITLFLGCIAHIFDDPGTVFMISRISVLITLIPILLFAFASYEKNESVVCITLFLLLCNYIFTMHGIEFRYDWAILAGLMVAYTCMLKQNRLACFLLGLSISWLFFHHMKGVYYAVFTYGTACISIFYNKKGKLSSYLYAHLGLLVAFLIWGVISAYYGFLNDIIVAYKTFTDLALNSVKMWPWETLRGPFKKDISWWLLSLIFVTLGSFRILKTGTKDEKRKYIITSSFILAGLFFLMIHPHPWPYLLVIPISFISIVISKEIYLFCNGNLIKKNVLPLSLFVILAALQCLVSDHFIINSYLKSFDKENFHQVNTLRLLKKLARNDDKILDPSGLSYFVEPIEKEWYSDTLFREKILKGEWMTKTEKMIPEECPFILITYRLGNLKPSLQKKIMKNYISIGGGIGVSKMDERVTYKINRKLFPYNQLTNVW